MTFEQATRIKPGDKIHWRDPDESFEDCSRTLTVAHIEFHGDDAIIIEDDDGDILGCLPNEIEYAEPPDAPGFEDGFCENY